MNSAALYGLTSIMERNQKGHQIQQPHLRFYQVQGITRTAVVLLLIIPIADSSAMIAEIVSAVVSPGIAIMSRPTEHTHVIASNLSRDKLPQIRHQSYQHLQILE